MTFRPPWLSHNSLRRAYLAFDMDTPADMPIRPILQVTKLSVSTVTMGNKKQSTIKSPIPTSQINHRIQCTDGGLAGQDMGLTRAVVGGLIVRDNISATRYVGLESD